MRGLLPVLRDLDSRNGLYINDARVSERAIGPGDVVRVGEWVGLVGECTALDAALEFEELAPGWHGGRVLSVAVAAARRVATTALPVIIEGPSGSGKEGLAQAIHRWSGRRGPFVAVDCGALPEQLAEAELFGYRKGAFTGADRHHDGHLRAAHEGTLFLDELLNLSPMLQAKLLRAIQQREVMSLGTSQAVPVDVRFVCAAQGSLTEAVAAGRFREDLFARLDGVTVALPALRQRREDIVPLFKRFIAPLVGEETASRLEPRFVEALLLYDWPLNVRELSLLAQRLVALHGHEPRFKRSMLPGRFNTAPSLAQESAADGRAKRSPADDHGDFQALRASLQRNGANLSLAAKELGMSRARAYRVLAAHPEYDLKQLRGDHGP
jgi:transcriptional regulator with PAS, ATPase and Fis domain